jgi:putative heme-binding domain-containing protein
LIARRRGTAHRGGDLSRARALRARSPQRSRSIDKSHRRDRGAVAISDRSRRHLALHFGRVSASSAVEGASSNLAHLSPTPPSQPGQIPPRSSRTCQQCHTLFGVGANVGPDITGSNRADLDYLLTNIVDPSAVVAKEYQVTLVWLKDERLLSGILKKQDEQSLTLQDQQGTNVVPRGDIDEVKPAGPSMMPEGQIDVMSADEVRDLIAYFQLPRRRRCAPPRTTLASSSTARRSPAGRATCDLLGRRRTIFAAPGLSARVPYSELDLATSVWS